MHLANQLLHAYNYSLHLSVVSYTWTYMVILAAQRQGRGWGSLTDQPVGSLMMESIMHYMIYYNYNELMCSISAVWFVEFSLIGNV